MVQTLAPTGRWVLVTSPEYYGALPEELRRNDGLVTWSAPRQLAVGDLALLYESSPSKEFKWLLRARSEPVPDDYFKYMAWFEVIGFERGVGFAEAAKDPIISTFPKMKAHLVGSNHVVSEGVWERLLGLLVERNPKTRATVEGWSEQLSEPLERALEDFTPADSYGFQPIFRLEQEMEDFVMDYLVEEGMARLPKASDQLGLKGRQDRLGPAMRTDLVLPACEPIDDHPTLGLLELKLWANGLAAVRQATRYRAELQNRYPAWRVIAHLVAQGFSTAVIQAATDDDIVCWEVRDDDGLYMEPINLEDDGE